MSYKNEYEHNDEDAEYRMFEVEYATVPNPATVYYHGTVKVWARESDEAAEKAISKLSRNAAFPRSLIRVKKVSVSY